MSNLNEQLECAFEGIGRELGEVIKCLVQQEISSHMQRIEQLQQVLTGNICMQSQNQPQVEVPPTT